VGLYHPGEQLWHHWGRLAPLYFGVGQTLLAAGIPWRVASRPEQLAGLEVLLTVAPLPVELQVPPALRVIHVPVLVGWEPNRPSLLARHAVLRRAVALGATELYQAYFRYRWARFLLDRAGLAHFYLQSPFFRLPSTETRQTLLAALGEGPWPRVKGAAPVLVEWCEQRGQQQLHLVNYADAPQDAQVDFGRVVRGRVLSPDGDVVAVQGESLTLGLDVYALILLEEDR
jgi:hypothetical protein